MVFAESANSYLQITAPILWLQRSRCITMWQQKVLCGLVFVELNKAIASLLIRESNWFQKLQGIVNNCSWVASACCFFLFSGLNYNFIIFSKGWSRTIKVTRLFFPVSGTALQWYCSTSSFKLAVNIKQWKQHWRVKLCCFQERC